MSAPLVPLDDLEQENLRRTIGDRCRRARTELGLSQRAMAKEMGRSRSWVRELEAGDQYAPAYLVRALATATCRTVGWFYGEPGAAERIAAEVLELIRERSA